MMRLPNRPLLAVLALLRAGAVACVIGLLGVGVIAYLPEWERVGWALIAVGGAAGWLVFCGVVAGGILDEHREIDASNQRNAEKQELEIERRRLELDAMRQTVTPDAEPDGLTPEWAEALGRWFRAGDRLGFGVRDLTPDIVSGPDWARLQAFYCSDAGWGVLVWQGGQRVTEWGEGWNLPTVLSEIEAGRLPYPEGQPPTVHLLVVDTTKTLKKHNREGQGSGAVVEGVARPAD